MDSSIIASLNELLGQPVEIIYSTTVEKINKYSRLQRRILVLGNNCLFTLKVGGGNKKKVSIQRQDHLYNLSDVRISDHEAAMIFPDFQLRFIPDSSFMMDLILNLFQEYSKLTNCCHDETTATFSGQYSGTTITSSYLASKVHIKLSPSTAFAFRFNAACKLYDAKPSYDTKTRLISSFPNHAGGDIGQEPVLLLTPEQYPHIDTPTIQALFKALFYGTFFTQIIIQNVSLKDIGTIAVLDAVYRFHCVRVLELSKVGATVESVPAIARTLNRATGFDRFDLSGNVLEDEGLKVVAGVIATWDKPLDQIIVSRFRSTSLGTEHLTAAINNNSNIHPTLHTLDMSGNGFGAAAAEHLVRYLQSESCRLEKIMLNNCQIVSDGSVIIAAARCPTITDINLSRNAFTDSVGLQLCSAIANSRSLNRIDLSFLKVSPRVIEAIVAATIGAKNKHEVKLNLSGNDLGEQVGAKIASLFQSGEGIREVVMDNCELGQASTMWIIKSLTGHGIERLSISGNITEGEQRTKKEEEMFSEALVEFIKGTETIQDLAVADNSTARAPINLIPMLESVEKGHGRLLRALDLQGNSIGDEGITLLAKIIAKNSSLTSLYIDHNNIKVRGFETLAAAIDLNTSLINMPFPARDFKSALLTAGGNQDDLKNLPSRIEAKLLRNRVESSSDHQTQVV